MVRPPIELRRFQRPYWVRGRDAHVRCESRARVPRWARRGHARAGAHARADGRPAHRPAAPEAVDTLRRMLAQINLVERDEFLARVYEDTDRFMEAIDRSEVYIVKGFYPRDLVLE